MAATSVSMYAAIAFSSVSSAVPAASIVCTTGTNTTPVTASCRRIASTPPAFVTCEDATSIEYRLPRPSPIECFTNVPAATATADEAPSKIVPRDTPVCQTPPIRCWLSFVEKVDEYSSVVYGRSVVES